jgi:hypothetical protein
MGGHCKLVISRNPIGWSARFWLRLGTIIYPSPRPDFCIFRFSSSVRAAHLFLPMCVVYKQSIPAHVCSKTRPFSYWLVGQTCFRSLSHRICFFSISLWSNSVATNVFGSLYPRFCCLEPKRLLLVFGRSHRSNTTSQPELCSTVFLHMSATIPQYTGSPQDY